MNNESRTFIATIRSRFLRGDLSVSTQSPDGSLDYALSIEDVNTAESFVEITEAYIEYADEMILNFNHSDQDLEFIKELQAHALVRLTMFDGMDGYPLHEQERSFNPFLKFYAPDAELNSETIKAIYLAGSRALKVQLIKAYDLLGCTPY